VHLAHLGYPIAGDDKYGDFELNKQLGRSGLKRMFLHAASVTFRHPASGQKVTVEALLPEELQGFLKKLD
jgi:23S rRNA pseudouridine955/2504/2580 synthase